MREFYLFVVQMKRLHHNLCVGITVFTKNVLGVSNARYFSSFLLKELTHFPHEA